MIYEKQKPSCQKWAISEWVMIHDFVDRLETRKYSLKTISKLGLTGLIGEKMNAT